MSGCELGALQAGCAIEREAMNYLFKAQLAYDQQFSTNFLIILSQQGSASGKVVAASPWLKE